MFKKNCVCSKGKIEIFICNLKDENTYPQTIVEVLS